VRIAKERTVNITAHACFLALPAVHPSLDGNTRNQSVLANRLMRRDLGGSPSCHTAAGIQTLEAA